jgi:hypothetical protein
MAIYLGKDTKPQSADGASRTRLIDGKIIGKRQSSTKPVESDDRFHIGINLKEKM